MSTALLPWPVGRLESLLPLMRRRHRHEAPRGRGAAKVWWQGLWCCSCGDQGVRRLPMPARLHLGVLERLVHVHFVLWWWHENAEARQDSGAIRRCCLPPGSDRRRDVQHQALPSQLRMGLVGRMDRLHKDVRQRVPRKATHSQAGGAARWPSLPRAYAREAAVQRSELSNRLQMGDVGQLERLREDMWWRIANPKAIPLVRGHTWRKRMRWL